MNRTLVIVLSLSVLSLVVYYFVIKSIVEKRNTGRSYNLIPVEFEPTIDGTPDVAPGGVKQETDISNL
jgi:hypothetical protein